MYYTHNFTIIYPGLKKYRWDWSVMESKCLCFSFKHWEGIDSFTYQSKQLLWQREQPAVNTLPPFTLLLAGFQRCGGIFTYFQIKHAVSVLNGGWHECFPADHIIKGESHSKLERWRGLRKKWVGCLSSAGTLLSRHKSSDVTNAVNVLVCFEYGLPWRAKPINALLPLSSPTHFKIYGEKQFRTFVLFFSF